LQSRILVLLTKPVEIWLSAEGARAVAERAAQRNQELGVAFCDVLQQQMSLRRSGHDVDLFLRACGEGECLKLHLPAGRFEGIVGLLLSHRCLRLRSPARRARLPSLQLTEERDCPRTAS
jgi:hypothetical protein